MREEKKENIEWSASDDNLLSLPAEKIEPAVEEKKISPMIKKTAPKEPVITYEYFIYNAEKNSTINLNEFVELSDIRNVRWDPQEKNVLFFLNGKSLYRLNTDDSKSLSLISEEVSAFDLTESFVYFCDSSNNLVFRTTLDGQDEKEQITYSFPENQETVEKMIVYDESRIAFNTANKHLVIFNQGEREDYFKKIGENNEGMQFSDDGKKILFWTNNEISVYFLRDWNVQPERNEDQSFNITRYAENIRNVQWFKDYEHVIFNAGHSMKIVEIDCRDRINSLNFPEISIDTSQIVYNNFLEKLFFTDKKDDPTSLFSINFPEKTTFLGL
jgi:hypothetical protein